MNLRTTILVLLLVATATTTLVELAPTASADICYGAATPSGGCDGLYHSDNGLSCVGYYNGWTGKCNST